MRKLLAAVVAAAGVLAIVAGPVSAGTTIHVHGQVVGAEISGTQAVFKIHISTGANGAGVQNVKVNSAGTGGTSTAIIYWGTGTQSLKGPFTLGAPTAQGIFALDGTARIVGGTGAYQGVHGKLTIHGTLDTKTLTYKFSFSATETK
jgi:hypothetical protein